MNSDLENAICPSVRGEGTHCQLLLLHVQLQEAFSVHRELPTILQFLLASLDSVKKNMNIFPLCQLLNFH